MVIGKSGRWGNADAGSVSVLPLTGVVVVTGAATVAGALVAGALTHTRADAAADLVAIAAANQLLVSPEPCATAAVVAAEHSVELSRCDVRGTLVTVTVAAALPPLLQRALPGVAFESRSAAELVVQR